MSRADIKITLEHPLKQGEKGDKKISEINLRKPMAGELRGIKLLDIMQMDVNAFVPLLGRITTPMLSETQVYSLDPVDLIQIMTGVHGFFVTSHSPVV